MHIHRKALRLALFLSLLMAAALPAAAAQRTAPFVLAVIPSAPSVTMHTLWAPFLERLARETGLGFRLKVYEQMSEFEQDISRGAADFLFVNPLQAVVAHEAQGYIPLVRGGRTVAAELFVRRDSPIRSVDDLADRKIAMIGNKNL